MEIAIIAPGREVGAWSDLINVNSGIKPQIWPDIQNPDLVELAIAWKPPQGVFNTFNNLKLISSFGAGVDNILSDSLIPDVPIVRIVDAKLTEDFSNFMVMQVLNFHNGTWQHIENQKQHHWELDRLPRSTWEVGVLGFGVLGKVVAEKLSFLGFKIHALQRRPKQNQNIRTYGIGDLGQLMSQVDILINLLPLTRDTRGILNLKNFQKASKPFYLINGARGEHLIEGDLLKALDLGLIQGACLDVFTQEPLPSSHPFWDNSKVIVTPHIAGISNPETVVEQILENFTRVKQGRPLFNQIDVITGY